MSWGVETTRKDKLFLNIYDLTSNGVLHNIGIGAYHSGVQFRDEEYTFAGGAGVFHHGPKEAPGAVYRETLEIGSFEGGMTRVREVIEALQEEFGSTRYHVILNNCNHFSDRFCKLLTGKTIPPYVNRLAYIGSFAECLFPDRFKRSLTSGTPYSQVTEVGFTAFRGSGRKLNDVGSTSAPTQDNVSLIPSSAGETERLEMLRKQRLAKFDSS
ncbi:hypothetical protein CYMTET_25588 [Cymbomonas tetramitiformis]|uniref:PPPDE domain-containing protein n=1 Tax=Cymbomonas tetramitiformis TaxID=36881 RepID=A0AAE0FTE6_9CHLO|nr:hypothetical protein CYMTET_25588 [Cymbomonas tetramitiformis]|eukprot:gene14696-17364_t